MARARAVRKRPRTEASEAEVLAGTLAALALFGPALEVERNNVGGFRNPSGQYVRFGRESDADIRIQICKGPHRGKVMMLEVKKGGFDPRRVRGGEGARFLGQLARMREVVANGGIAAWVNDARQVALMMPRILEGLRVEFDEGGFPWLTDEA